MCKVKFNPTGTTYLYFPISTESYMCIYNFNTYDITSNDIVEIYGIKL